MTETYYDVLGVDPDADRAEIERAYRQAVRRHHPDVTDRPDADERIRAINRARDVLTDLEERIRYDDLGHDTYLRRVAHPGPAPAGNADGPGTTPAAEAAADRIASGRLEGATTAVGSFAVREFVSAVLLGGLVAAALVLATGYLDVVAPADRPVDGSVLFALLWVGVALVAGELAAGGANRLPENPTQAYALPLSIVALSLVGRAGVLAADGVVWYARAGALVVAYGVTVYGAYAALFRAAAAAGASRQALAPAAVWFVGSVPAALALYAWLFPVGGLGRELGRWAGAAAADAGAPLVGVLTTPALVAVLVPLSIAICHALWAGVGRLRASIEPPGARGAR